MVGQGKNGHRLYGHGTILFELFFRNKVEMG